jgi:hypothetical protein
MSLCQPDYLQQVISNVHSKSIIESFPSKVHMTKLTNKNEIIKNKTLGSFHLISPKMYNKSVYIAFSAHSMFLE